VTSPGIDAGTVRLVAQRLYHYANPGPFKILVAAEMGVLAKEIIHEEPFPLPQ
jgi:hypothetical protein